MRQPSLKAFSSALVVLIIAECVLGLPSTSAAPAKSESLRDKTCLATPKQSPIRNLRLYIPLGVGAVASMAVGIISTTTPFIPCLLLAEFLVAAALFDWKASQYQSLIADNTIDIDQYTCSRPSMYDRAKVVTLHGFSVGNHKRSLEPIKLGYQSSPFVKGLVATKRLQEGLSPMSLDLSKKPLVVGTIRMGFGHHRIAYSAASWGLASGSFTFFHDLLAVESKEATLIKEADKVYSKGSRLASELGGVIEALWGSITKSGDASSLRCTYQLAENLRPLLLDIPKDIPIIATHSLVGLVAVACGFKNVINLVIDNYAQWFVIVPGAINLVQGPTNYAMFHKMGVPTSELRLAGHWVPYDIVTNIDSDCERRRQRLKDEKPLRILLPVGGAGAQRKFVTSLLEALADEIKAGSVQVVLNAGDHAHMRDAFETSFKKMGLSSEDVTVFGDIDGVHNFCDEMRAGKEPRTGVTMFSFKDYFPAVAATDLLSRVVDVLACKPSELAFYPVPKLMIRRVGDHEAYSALRASELGDGTLEVREVKDAVEWIQLMKDNAGILDMMNDKIIANGKQGVYDGCKEAVRLAHELAGYKGSSE
uniref:Uncharacterized protein n=1 Tax=Guillardia theta TaxID=55529 RepID=A0A7S4U6W7_GUITH|mmetsp:Transcript_45600/g.143201  ORF Transcript_45600/g.143201 Transcript_45600/m.143201 type:complete len:592 (+) Transcript_45600:63-1838(+)